MDPNATLESILELARTIDEEEEDDQLGIVAMAETAQGLARDILNLDEWLRKGGFYPEAWRTQLPAVKTEQRARAFLKSTGIRADEIMVKALAELLEEWRGER